MPGHGRSPMRRTRTRTPSMTGFIEDDYARRLITPAPENLSSYAIDSRSPQLEHRSRVQQWCALGSPPREHHGFSRLRRAT